MFYLVMFDSFLRDQNAKLSLLSPAAAVVTEYDSEGCAADNIRILTGN